MSSRWSSKPSSLSWATMPPCQFLSSLLEKAAGQPGLESAQSSRAGGRREPALIPWDLARRQQGGTRVSLCCPHLLWDS